MTIGWIGRSGRIELFRAYVVEPERTHGDEWGPLGKGQLFQRGQPSRRSVVAASAWSVPAIVASSALSAYATSECVTTVGVWRPSSALSEGATYNLEKIRDVDTWEDNNVIADYWHKMPDDYDLTPTDKDTLKSTWLNLAQAVRADDKDGLGQTLTITFSRPVYGLAFYIGQIDSSHDAPAWYIDKVTVTATGDGTSHPVFKTRHDYKYGALKNSLQVDGEGTNRVTAVSDSRVAQFTDNGGNHRGTIRFETSATEAVTQITVFYGDTQPGGNASKHGMGRQYVSISPMRWSTCPQ
ncbi:MAG: hypothetical protein E6243_07875 [Cutibacterium avidum]|uniref:hypothetical protein n=1 Tax=Cutibacterium avidum TaxID=33010 RepID=UPI001C847AD0|nr:hypothetical protein [Cutibacterium avidum]MBS6261031.1 hypothetical protein [Propionibacterium sp.]MCO6663288.1 hypothetical protein [Cutibacterium avidum]MCO6683551.1 hypothetical protein [Cutibacterium avidum]MCO6685934.1 hypothetical protein [Cutibacterium avidum]MCO6687921.1 hypothetical protein [Cutibacterium avidum]